MFTDLDITYITHYLHVVVFFVPACSYIKKYLSQHTKTTPWKKNLEITHCVLRSEPSRECRLVHWNSQCRHTKLQQPVFAPHKNTNKINKWSCWDLNLCIPRDYHHPAWTFSLQISSDLLKKTWPPFEIKCSHVSFNVYI